MLALTGVTGHVGGMVARQLAESCHRMRLIARDPARVPDLPGCRVAVASFGDSAAVRRALEGVDTVLMVSAGESAERVEQHRTFVAAAAQAGVRHVVYTSFLGAADDATFTLARDHAATEKMIMDTPMRWTFLRDSFYLDALIEFIGPDGVLRGPAGQGRVAAVARSDVAAVAAAVLRSPAEHAGRAYELTGPQALTLDDVAEIVTDVTGRPVRYHDETLPEAYASRAAYGAPDWQVEAWVSTYTAIASDRMAAVTDWVPRLSGRPATSLADLLRAGDGTR